MATPETKKPEPPAVEPDPRPDDRATDPTRAMADPTNRESRSFLDTLRRALSAVCF